MNEFIIEDNIPIPEKGKNKNAAMYEAAKKMQVGQSMVVAKQRSGITNALARITGFKFTQKACGEDQMRIWRIE